jgi:hypothetical protein
MKAKPLPPFNVLQELLDYRPETGLLHWRSRFDGTQSWNSRYAGKVAGYVFLKGKYIGIHILNKTYLAHRIIFKMMTGVDPTGEVDHRDLDGTNNVWTNLRDSTKSQNQANAPVRSHSSIGLKGVTFHKETGKYRARVRCKGTVYDCGLHNTPAAAHAAYAARAKELHGEFSREA